LEKWWVFFIFVYISKTLTEIVLFQQIVHGDKKAFDQLFLSNYKRLCSFANTFLNDSYEAEEAVQKMFVRLWENRKKLIIPENPKAFLFKSVYHESMKILRHKTTHSKHITDYFRNLRPADEERTNYSYFLPHLNKAVEKLPDKCRQIFILYKMEGLTQKEIANYLEISVKSVENQVAIAILKLREELKPYLHLLPATFLFTFFY
jgi:RNA polymerase sigma-70 factor, ECF subfamily